MQGGKRVKSNKDQFRIFSNPCWIISGSNQNFTYALNCQQTWGVIDKWFPQWKAISKGDLLFFYIYDVKRIIGVGRATDQKFIQREPLWPDELEQNELKYPLRFLFSLEFLLDEADWKNRGIEITTFVKSTFGPGALAELFRGGITFIRYKELVDYLIDECKNKFGYEIKRLAYEIPMVEEKIEAPDKEKRHSALKDLILEIGKMNGFLTASEFSFDKLRFDSIWKRVDKGSPTYVFEVQVGGDIYRALAKLKHAYDLWSSKVFLITSSSDDRNQAFKLLEGTFHEIADKIKIISSEDIFELYKRKRSWMDFEKQVGIL